MINIYFRLKIKQQINIFEDNVAIAVDVIHRIHRILVRYLLRQKLESVPMIWTDFL